MALEVVSDLFLSIPETITNNRTAHGRAPKMDCGLKKSIISLNRGQTGRMFSGVQGEMNFLGQGLIVTMGGHIGVNASSKVKSEETEVTNQVQYLVAHEFVGITEFRIDDLAVVHDDVGMEISASNLS